MKISSICGMLLGSVALLVILAGCENKSNPNSQAILKVDGEEITVHQINDELAHQNQSANDEAALNLQRKKALENVIDRQILTNKAVQDDLNKDVEVLTAIERMKAQMLAQAYIQKHLDNPPLPTEMEVASYYNAHPDLYAQRKIFDMTEVQIDAKAFNAEVEQAVKDAKSVVDVITWLDLHRVKNSVGHTVRSSLELPESVVTRLRAGGAAPVFVLRDADQVTLIALALIKESPLSLSESSSAISDYLIAKKKQDAAVAMMQRLRAESKLQWLNPKAIGVDEKNIALFADDDAAPAATDNGSSGNAALTH